jgi:hypothetical protein
MSCGVESFSFASLRASILAVASRKTVNAESMKTVRELFSALDESHLMNKEPLSRNILA